MFYWLKLLIFTHNIICDVLIGWDFSFSHRILSVMFWLAEAARVIDSLKFSVGCGLDQFVADIKSLLRYRGLRAANNQASSASQNVAITILHEKPQELVPCSPPKLQHSNRVTDWLIPKKGFKASSRTCSVMIKQISGTEMRQITLI